MSPVPPSTSQVNKAGKTLRAHQRGEVVTYSKRMAALTVLRRFRAAHVVPLTKTNMGLRSMVRTEGCRVEVSQRLKRVATILDKLTRQPTMQLANMQDIGGCRAVLDNIDEVRRVQKRLAKNRPPIRVNDYVGQPRSSGYRAVHLVVQYDDRNIEVQLRTRVMHEWAFTVERLGGRLQADLKSGRGPQAVLDLLEAISEAMALEEAGQDVDSALMDRLGRLREAALPYLAGP
jgi:putative GTP pyrophosphokinase